MDLPTTNHHHIHSISLVRKNYESYVMKIFTTWILIFCCAYLLLSVSGRSVSVAVISNNRHESLKRLCDSLLRTKNPKNRSIRLIFNLEASSSNELIQYAHEFQWPFGEKLIKLRVRQGGLIPAVLESWYPVDKHDHGVILEDDIEVSPFWLMWVDKVLDGIRKGAFRILGSRIIGISLYSPRVTETVFPKRAFYSQNITTEFSGNRQYPYVMQTPCSWGAFFFSKQWMHFLSYARHRLSSSPTYRPVLIPGSRTNGWKQSWKKFMFEFMYLKGLFMVYPNFDGQYSFSTNHMEIGEHITEKKLTLQTEFTVPLLTDGEVLEDLKFIPSMRVAALNLFGTPLADAVILKESLFAAINYTSPPQRKDEFYVPTFSLDVLGSGHAMLSTREDLIRSAVNDDGSFYQGMLQPDGNFVVRKQQEGDDTPIGITWSSKCHSEHSSVFFLSPSGVISIVDATNKTIWQSSSAHTKSFFTKLWPERKQKTPLSDSELHNLRESYNLRPDVHTGTLLRYPLLRLESNGNLILYKSRNADLSCDVNGVLWSSMELTRDSKNIPDRCLSEKEKKKRISSRRSESSMCNKFPIGTNRFLSSNSYGVTLVLATFDRYELLQKQIQYYSSCSLVRSIVVVWHKSNVPPPPTAFIRNAIVHFVAAKSDSLNNRFVPSVLITTDCVLVLDDDMKIHTEDIHLLYAVWSKYPRNIVGFFPRWLDVGKGGSFVYNPDPFASDELGYKGYSLMLTKVMMFHNDLLFNYSCSRDMHPFLDMVDEYMNCEDIFMNGAAALSPRDLIGGTPALYVEPIHRIGDFGVENPSKGGLFTRQGHMGIRSTCCNKLNTVYKSIVGASWPVQTKVVKRKVNENKKKKEVLLWVESYDKIPDRVHSDCPSLQGDNECNFLRSMKKDNPPSFVWVANYIP